MQAFISLILTLPHANKFKVERDGFWKIQTLTSSKSCGAALFNRTASEIEIRGNTVLKQSGILALG